MPSNSSEDEWPWVCREDSTKIDRRIGCARIEVVQHPLEQSTATSSGWSGKKDPLSRSVASEPLVLMLDGDDPLSAFHKRQMEPSNTEDDDDSDNVVAGDPVDAFRGLEPWTTKKAKILSQSNSHELASNMSCFALQDRDLSMLALKSSHRDDFEDGITFDNDVSAQEFCKRLDCFHADMVQSWNEDQRVKALKIAIQCSKLLSDTLPHSYYPNRYIHVTDILDTFGNLVYDRLKRKCSESWFRQKCRQTTGNLKQSKMTFPLQLASEVVPDEVKETCLNWFYKIASIRELIPRLYVEATLLQSYCFIKTRENGKILQRLTETARGIGDPLVNLYSRCYLCRVGVHLKVTDFKFFSVNLDEFLAIYDTIFLRLPKIRLNYPKYVMAFVPPFEWIVQGVLVNDESMQQVLFERFRGRQNNTLLLYVILTSFSHSFVVSHATEVKEWLDNCNFEHVPLFKFLSQLAHCYSEQRKNFGTDVPEDIMNAVWDFIFRIDTATHYLTCLEKWLPLSNDCLPPSRIDSLFQKTMNLIHKDRTDEKSVFKQLRDVVLNLTQCADDFLPLLTANNFLPFLNLFRDDQTKIPVCKSILEAFVNREEDRIMGDTIILNNLMVVAKAIHDSMSALTVVDERRQIGNLLSKFVLKINFGRDFEQQLDFYVEARGAFFNSDMVHYTLVHRVNKLAFDTLIVVKGRHKSKTSTFVRACAAFCFITIPSLSSPLQRLQLYMLSGQVALANQCLGQADSFFCEAMNTILQFTEIIESASANVKGEPILISYIKELLSILLVVPDNPEENVMLGLVRKLVDNISQFKWEDGDTTMCSLYIQVLHLLSAAYQDDYPYHAQNVDSNDTLYASDPHFKREIDRLCSEYLGKILGILQELGIDGKSNKQGMLAYELFFCILSRADVSIREITKLAVNVWNLARRNGTFDKRVAVQTLEYCIRSSPRESIYNEIFQKLLAKLD